MQSAGQLRSPSYGTRTNAAEEHAPSSRYVWYVILLLSFVNLINYVDRMALAVLAPYIKAELGLSDSQLGLLTGFSFALFYAVCALPIAHWADRGVRRNIIVLALTIWSTMTALSGAAQSFWQLFLARVGVGAGEAGSYSPGASILCDYVPLRGRSGALAVHAFGNYAGILLGMALAGWLGAAVGWRWTFVALGLPGIALAVIVRFTLREPTRGIYDAEELERNDLSIGATIKSLRGCRTYRLLTLFLVANGFVQYGLNQWWPSFYARSFDIELASVGVYLGFAIGVGAGVGVLVGGVLANKVARRDASLPLIVGAIATALALPTAFGSLFSSSMPVSLVLVLLTGLFWGVSNGPALAGLYNVVSPKIRATAGAIAIFFIAVFGFGLGPFCVGFLSDALNPLLGVDSLRYAMLVPVCITVVMVIALLGAAKTLPHDLKAVGAQVDAASAPKVDVRLAVAK